MAGSVRAESSDRAPDADSVGSCKAGSPAATTPGPWGLRGYQIRAEGGRGQHIATYMTTRSDGLLLASAPALVSALEELVRRCPFKPTATGISVEITFAQIAQAQNALRLAKGGRT